MEKRCYMCGELKSIDCFYIKNKYTNLLRHDCKTCFGARSKRRYLVSKDKFKEMAKLNYYKNWGKKQIKRKEWIEKNKEKFSIYKKKWRENNKDYLRYISKAHDAIRRALKSEKLVRPHNCQECLAEAQTEAHHHKGYDKENRLNVIFLCVKCHKKADYINRLDKKIKNHINIYEKTNSVL